MIFCFLLARSLFEEHTWHMIPKSLRRFSLVIVLLSNSAYCTDSRRYGWFDYSVYQKDCIEFKNLQFWTETSPQQNPGYPVKDSTASLCNKDDEKWYIILKLAILNKMYEDDLSYCMYHPFRPDKYAFRWRTSRQC
jgi:hypothetical protein